MNYVSLCVIVTAALCGLCGGQMLEDRLLGMMKTAITQIEELSQKVDDVRERMTTLEEQSLVRDALSKLASKTEITEIQATFVSERNLMRDALNKLASSSELAQTQETLLEEFQETKEGVERCSCGEQLSDLQRLLVTDVDECKEGVHKCHRHAICKNTAGGYTCQCRQPYIGDGYKCDGPPCDPPSKIIDGLGCVIPMNERATWPQARDKCHSLGFRLLEGLATDEQRNLLRHHFNNYFSFINQFHDVWLGIKQNKWIQSGHLSVPSSFWAGSQLAGGPGECGYIALQHSPPNLWDTGCSNFKIVSLCQFLED